MTAGLGAVAHADAASPSVTGPVSGMPVIFAQTTFDLASVGYTQAEFFLEGTADAYTPTAPLASDGKWSVEASSQAPYTTRIVVNRPTKKRAFNGTVVVEWLNVSGGVDASPDWIHMHVELIRRGYAWAGVSAQAVGLNALKGEERGNPARYEPLTHPGDSYSYDMFSQAGQAIRDNARSILGGLKPERLIAVGESQSAGRLVTYIDAAHPLVQVYDGFLVHSRSGGGAPLSQSPLPGVGAPTPALIRDDLDVPVLVFQTENDRGGLAARQDDSRTFRLWEVAGTAHFDLYGLRQGAGDIGARATYAEWFDSMLNPTAQPSPSLTCNSPINTGPQTFVLRAAIAALNEWVANGTPPPRAPRLTLGTPPMPYALDANGNVLGGIRTPAVDAPVATLSGFGQAGQQFCFLFGTTVPLSPERLSALYDDHRGFVKAWNRATRQAVKAGFLLREDAKHLRAVATQSSVLQP